MKKGIVFVLLLLLLSTTLIFTACNNTTSIANMKISKEDILSFEITYENGTKITERTEKITAAYLEVEKLSLTKCDEKIIQGIFEDSIVAQICFNAKEIEGKYKMTFVFTELNGEKVCLAKCEGVEGFKASKMPKGIYKTTSPQAAEQVFVKIFNNIL